MTIFIALSSNKPVVTLLVLAGHGDVAGGLGLEIAGVAPIAWHVANELEGIIILLVVLGQVGSHLKWRIHCQIQGKLTDKSGMDVVGIVAPGIELGFKNAGCVVHRSTLQTGERQDDGVVGTATAESLILCTAGRLVAHEVGVGTAKTRRTHGLMSVHHDVVLGSLFEDIHIVVVHRLRVMVVASWDNVAHITCLHCVVTILVHEVERIF